MYLRYPRGLSVRIATTINLPTDGAGRPHNHNQLHRPPPSAMAPQRGGKSGAECLRMIAIHLPSPSENPWSRRRCPERLWPFELGPRLDGGLGRAPRFTSDGPNLREQHFLRAQACFLAFSRSFYAPPHARWCNSALSQLLPLNF